MEKNEKPARWQSRIGFVMSGIVILFMLFDATIKFIKPLPVIESTVNELGYADHHILVHGILALVATGLYAIPRTSILGALLLTAHFGGAIASNLRVDNPLVTHVLFPVYLGIIMWGGIWLRDNGLRKLIPLTKF
jgi:hypothetical protein